MLPKEFTPEYLSQLELLRVHARRAFLGRKQGGHVSLKRGHGIEFSDYRQYELGDSPRHIDWGVYGRTDKLFVKRFREEQDLNLALILDCSSSMSVPELYSKWGMAKSIALSLAYVALLEQDSVCLYCLGLSQSPTFYGVRAIHSIAKILNQTQAAAGQNFAADLQQAASRLRFPGVAVVLSDFLAPLDQIERGFNMLRAKNMDISAIQILSPDDLDPPGDLSNAFAVDSETGEQLSLRLNEQDRKEYAEALVEHNENLKLYFSAARISHSLAFSNKPAGDFVLGTLTQIGLLR
ncbi:MAG: hypothetical protein DCC75_00970 [Proteobacteria bacterium]|nr:MAG: hypothetical protein DCC75_00970 [Pseudomonadota bacterium]